MTGGAARALGAAALLAAALLASGAGPGAAEPVTLTPEAMRVAAHAALAAGEPDTARRLAQALIARDPDDAMAQIVLSRAERRSGRHAQALAASRHAHRAAQDPLARYAAATEAARAAQAAERPMLAQLWLRRARHAAPTPALRARAAAHYAAVGRTSPLSVRLGFGLRPSSNVNNGLQTDTLVLGGVPLVVNPAAQALSGVETTVDMVAAYRVAGPGGRPLRLGARLRHTDVALSSEARQQALDAEGSDYDLSAAEISVERALGPAYPDRVTRLRLTLGADRYGGEPLSRYAALGLFHDRALSPRLSGHLALDLRRRLREDRPERSATTVGARAGLRRALPGGRAMALSLGASDTRSDTPDAAYAEFRGDAALDLGRPVPGARVEAGLGLAVRRYEGRPFAPGGRHDLEATLSLGLGLERFEHYGFHPHLAVEAVRNASDDPLFDRRNVGLRLGLRSSF